MGRHTARCGGAASAVGMHDWSQRPMGGAEAQGEGSDWPKRDTSAQPVAAEPRAAHQTDR